MARNNSEKLTDDLDGSRAAETVTFELDGTTYEIDLSRKNAAVLRKTLDPYLNVARRAATGPTRHPRRSTNGGRP